MKLYDKYKDFLNEGLKFTKKDIQLEGGNEFKNVIQNLNFIDFYKNQLENKFDQKTIFDVLKFNPKLKTNYEALLNEYNRTLETWNTFYKKDNSFYLKKLNNLLDKKSEDSLYTLYSSLTEVWSDNVLEDEEIAQIITLLIENKIIASEKIVNYWINHVVKNNKYQEIKQKTEEAIEKVIDKYEYDVSNETQTDDDTDIDTTVVFDVSNPVKVINYLGMLFKIKNISKVKNVTSLRNEKNARNKTQSKKLNLIYVEDIPVIDEEEFNIYGTIETKDKKLSDGTIIPSLSIKDRMFLKYKDSKREDIDIENKKVFCAYCDSNKGKWLNYNDYGVSKMSRKVDLVHINPTCKSKECKNAHSNKEDVKSTYNKVVENFINETH